MSKLKKIKQTKGIKKILSFILVMLMVCTSFPLSAFAADINLGDAEGNSRISISTSSHYGHELHTTTVNGQTYPLFCIEYGKSSPSTSTLESQGVPSNRNQLEAARWIFAGYFMEHGNSIDWLDMAYCQKRVWAIMGDNTSWSFSDSGYQEWCNNAQNNMNNLNTYPSFDNTNIGNFLAGTSHTVVDTNGVLKDYPEFTYSNNGVTITHNANSNELTISIDKSCSSTSFSLRRGTYWKTITGDTNNCLLYAPASGGTQYLLYSAYYDPIDLYFTGSITPLGNIELTKQDIFGADVNGAEFGLYSDSACTNRIATATSSNGTVRFDYLTPATYYVKEEFSPEPYLLSDEIIRVTVSSNNTSTASVENEEPTGRITLTKELDTEKTNGLFGDVNIEEAEYTLYAAEDIRSGAGTHLFYSANEIVASGTITASSDGSSGTISWDNLPLGDYYVKETVNPEGTFIDDTTYNISLQYANQYESVIIDDDTLSVDELKSMKVKIFKAGSDGTAGQMVGLEGAEFTIKLYSDYEEALAQGYTEQEIWSQQNDNGDWIYYNNEGDAVIVDSDRAEEANVISPNYAVITTDTNGNAVSGYLPWGKYITKETYTPVDYTSGNDFSFSITEDESEVDVEEQVKLLVVNNAPIEYPVKIVKKDADSDKTVTLSSATFKIKATENIYNTTTGDIVYPANEYISYKVGSSTYDTFMTNSDGYVVPAVNNIYANANDDKGSVTTPFKLPAGDYAVVEIEEPNGFLINSEAVPFTITSLLDYDLDADGETVVTVNVKNEQPKGEININKSFAVVDNVDTNLISDIDYTKIGFKLTTAEDIIDMADGSIVYKAGTDLGNYYLNSDGSLTISNLWIGKYNLNEISTINGAVLDDTTYSVSFEVKDNTTAVYKENLDIVNHFTVTDISKTDITGSEEIEGAELSVIDSAGNIIDSWTSTSEAHRIVGLVTGETYTLREEYAPEGYVVASDLVFTVGNTVDVQDVTMVDKQVTISKIDVTTGEELEGAELEIQDKDGNVIDSWTSSNEVHYVTGLVEGETYVLIEKTAPYGFEKAESIEFTVTTDKDIQKVVMEDDYIYSAIRVIKCDITTKKPIVSNEFEFSIYADKDCTQLIATSGANQDEGTALFEKLKYGTYYLKETKAPTGYALSDKIVEIVINEDGVFADGVSLEGTDGVYSFEYYDELLPIIDTGDINANNTPKLILMGSLFIALAIAFVLISKKIRKQKKSSEKN